RLPAAPCHASRPSVDPMQSPTLPKPRLRGRLHQLAFFLSIPAGITLVALARGAEARVGAAVFAVSLSGLYGVSAAYHRGRWSARVHRVMRRLDHAMIYVLIAGSYTPVTLLALRPAWGITLLAVAWAGAAIGIVITVLRLERWPAAGDVLYLVLGWLAIVAGPHRARSLPGPGRGLAVPGARPLPGSRLGGDRRRPPAGPLPHRTGAGAARHRRRALHGGRGRARPAAPRPPPGGVRVPRGVAHVRRERQCLALRARPPPRASLSQVARVGPCG